jgi:hypothetical protein
MEEYSDLKFDGDLSFLNENLDAAKYAEKEALIKLEIVRAESAKSAREEFDRQERLKDDASMLAKVESDRNELEESIIKSSKEEIARLTKIELEKETERTAKIEAERIELEEEKDKAARIEAEKIKLEEEKDTAARIEAEKIELEEEKDTAARIEAEKMGLEEENDTAAKIEAEKIELEEETKTRAKIESEKIELEQEIARRTYEVSVREEDANQNNIIIATTYTSEPITQKPLENMEKSNETANYQENNSTNEKENALASRMEQGAVSKNTTSTGEKKSQLEEMVLNSGYGAEMFNNLKMELLELEKEKIIMKYKQDLMMMIIKS